MASTDGISVQGGVMNKTKENLKTAFSGESQTSIRYMAFAEKADAEGFPGTARLFRAAAKAVAVHAMNHLKAMSGINGTMENLEAAMRGESFELKEMYPAMVKDSVAENQIEARHSLEYAMSIKMLHHKLFQKAMENELENEVSCFYVCPVCGHTVREKAPKKCPYCGVDGAKFMEIK
jgi:rubrerythrin